MVALGIIAAVAALLLGAIVADAKINEAKYKLERIKRDHFDGGDEL